MQLVTKADHEASLPHKGAVKDFEEATNTKYGTREAKAAAKSKNQACSENSKEIMSKL